MKTTSKKQNKKKKKNSPVNRKKKSRGKISISPLRIIESPSKDREGVWGTLLMSLLSINAGQPKMINGKFEILKEKRPIEKASFQSSEAMLLPSI